MGRLGKLGFGFKTARNFWLMQRKDIDNKLMAEAWKLGREIQTLLNSEIVMTCAANNWCLTKARNSQWGGQGASEDSQASFRNCLTLEFPHVGLCQILQLTPFEQGCSSAFAETLWKQHFMLSSNRHFK